MHDARRGEIVIGRISLKWILPLPALELASDNLIVDAFVASTAKVIRPRRRKIEELRVAYRRQLAIATATREHAPVVARFDRGVTQHGRGIVRSFAGRLWTPITCHTDTKVVFPVESGALKLMLTGVIRSFKNSILMPSCVDEPDWADFKAIPDDGAASATLSANELASRLLLIDDVVYEQQQVLLHRLSIVRYQSLQFDRRIVPRGAAQSNRAFGVHFGLHQLETARRAEGMLVENFSIASHKFECDAWAIEVSKDVFAEHTPDLVASDCVASALAVGENTALLDGPIEALDRWIAVRRAIEEVEAGGLPDALLAPLEALARLPSWEDRDTLQRDACVAAGVIATRLAVSENPELQVIGSAALDRFKGVPC